jgi:hypothetical protein
MRRAGFAGYLRPSPPSPGSAYGRSCMWAREDEKRAGGDPYRSRKAATPLSTTASPESNSLP